MGGGKWKSLAAQWASSGGVDLADQRISSYKQHFKTCTWYLVVFFHGLEQCCLNSFISMQATPGHQDAKCTQLRFRAIDWWINLCKVKGKALNPSSSRSLLHYLVRRDEKQACIVHTQEVRTVYECAVRQKHVWRTLLSSLPHHARVQIWWSFEEQGKEWEKKSQNTRWVNFLYWYSLFFGFHGNHMGLEL